jgi:hypothetical protein
MSKKYLTRESKCIEIDQADEDYQPKYDHDSIVQYEKYSHLGGEVWMLDRGEQLNILNAHADYLETAQQRPGVVNAIRKIVRCVAEFDCLEIDPDNE